MIEVRGLKKTYHDGRVALRGVDLEIGEGMFGLLGPNGAGKTTLLSILVLALEPTSGHCTYDGLDPKSAKNRRKILQNIGYLPQEFAPIGHLTGFEYLMYCARLRRVPLSRVDLRRRVHLLLDAVTLSDAAHRRTGGYSGGMMRRLGLAQALVHTPRLLVVDEPTSGLDPEERIRFRNLITEVAERTAVLLSTHIVEDIEATCNRVGVIADGRFVFDDEPGVLLEAANGRLWEVPASDETHLGPDAPVVAQRMSEHGDRTRVLYSATPLSGARPVEPRLEDAYSAFLALHGSAEAPS